MWMFKPFSPKEQAGLEGRTIDVGNLKIHVRNAIAEGGFSCVYLARDAVHVSKQYALKHIVCSDQESLDLVMKEISVMKTLTGHPNIVSLHAHAIFDMGRTKEALLVMEFCEKSLVNVLEGRGSGYFEEKQILLIFRDVCNAVVAMHCLSPPIAHSQLPGELQKSLPDTPAGVRLPSADIPDGDFQNLSKSAPPRNPQAPSIGNSTKNVSQPSVNSKFSGSGGPMGAFWCTQYAHESVKKDGPVFDEASNQSSVKIDKLKNPDNCHQHEKAASKANPKDRAHQSVEKFDDRPPRDFELNFFPQDKVPQSESMAPSKNEAFNSFVADFDTSKLDSLSSKKSTKEQTLEAEVSRLKEQLTIANLEKDEITAKYEKLSAICRSQRQEIQELKKANAGTPSPNRDTSKVQNSSSSALREKIEGTVLELQQGMFNKSSSSPDTSQWKPFSDELKSQSKSNQTAIREANNNANATKIDSDTWGFGADNFAAVPSSSNIGKNRGQGNLTPYISASKTMETKRSSQPAGWAGF